MLKAPILQWMYNASVKFSLHLLRSSFGVFGWKRFFHLFTQALRLCYPRVGRRLMHVIAINIALFERGNLAEPSLLIYS